MKVALVFDNRVRSETTGLYCRRALGKLVDVEHLLPEELPLVSASFFDLFIYIDDGLDYALPEGLRPIAAWAIDTHLNLDRCARRFGDADWLFAAQRPGAERLSSLLGKTVRWLPLACDPQRHRHDPSISKCYEVGFVGHEIGERRRIVINELRKHFPSHWIGQAYHLDMARQLNQMHVAVNCSLAGDINMRIFETMACGTALVTDYIADSGLEELFDLQNHMRCYTDNESFRSQITHLLHNERLRNELSRAARAHVLENHTYDHRMMSLLRATQNQSMGASVGRHTVKSKAYFEFDRPDVAALVPLDAVNILDIGCGSGRLDQLLKLRQTCHVTGVESNSEAAVRAASNLDTVLQANIEQLATDTFQPEQFDCVIFADVLEHLRNPRAALELCRGWLKKDGALIISIPNTQHNSVVRGLLDGNWTYEHAGILDEDHVRCFTRIELEKLLHRSGFEVQELRRIRGAGYDTWLNAGNPSQVRLGPVAIEVPDMECAEDFFTYQFLAVARPRRCPEYPLTSIIICTYNQLSYTRCCIESILSRTDAPYELIFVDNGSTDGTPDYLKSLDGAQVILNESNRGFSPAVNQGIACARGEQLLLLNNDTVVTTGWLESMLEALHDRPDNGLVGPVSNNVSGPQQIEVTYSDLSCLDGFAWRLRNNRQLVQVDRLVGFCLLVKKEMVDRIGLLDERFEIGCFEDDDWCRRANQAGYKAFIAKHVFVHHFGSATFKAEGFDFSAIMRSNQERFEAKWASARPSCENALSDPASEPVRSSVRAELRLEKPSVETAVRSPNYRHVATPGGGQLLRRSCVQLSLCMIVRDNEDTIGACLDSIYPWVDELIIVDTGSTDGTIDICRQYDAIIHYFPWCDDFSAARNASLQPATGDWIFWMDSDDVIPFEQGLKLRQLTLGAHPTDVLGYVMQVHCPSGTGSEKTVVDHVKLFRNLPELRFQHRIHEQILPAVRAAGGLVQFTDIHVVHSGSRQTPFVRAKKLERDFRILALDLQDHPDHPFTLFNLGMTCDDAGDFEQAEQYLSRCIEVAHPSESQLRKAWALRVNCARSLGNLERALELATQGLGHFPGDKELLFRRATIHQDLGQMDEAIGDYEATLVPTQERHFQSLDPAICGYKAKHNLALAYQAVGKVGKAIQSWQAAVGEQSDFSSGWLGFIRCLVASGDLCKANKLVVGMSEETSCLTRSLAIALVREAEGQLQEAVESLSAPAWHHCESAEELDECARLLIAMGDYHSALPRLERLRVLRPADASVLYNLGATQHACGLVDECVESLRSAVRIRSDHPHASAMLARIIRPSDRPTEPDAKR